MRRLAFRYARDVVGTLNVDDMLRNMTSAQFTEWVAFSTLEPTPSDKICAYIRQMTMWLVMCHTGETPDPEEFYIDFDKEAETPEDKQKALTVKMKSALHQLKKRNPGALNKLSGPNKE